LFVSRKAALKNTIFGGLFKECKTLKVTQNAWPFCLLEMDYKATCSESSSVHDI